MSIKTARIYGILSLIALACVVAGCSSEGGDDDGTLKIVATTGMVGDLVRNIGGELVTVTTIMEPGVDPHLYKARPSDLDLLLSADMVFFNGLELEGKMSEAFENLRRGGMQVFAVGDLISEDRLKEWEQYEGKPDPHIWFDVSLWASAIDGVAQALKTELPGNEEQIDANARRYKTELEALHLWVGEQIRSIPQEQRVLITAHDAFQYFGAAYGIEVVGLKGISTVSEYGQRDIQRITDIISSRGIRAVFIESSVNPDGIRAVVEGAKAMGQQVEIGGELFSDAMGAFGTPEGTYIGMVRHNTNTIAAALK